MMKKIILNLALFLTATTLTAQSQPFPNGGFENWTGSGNTLLPVDFHSNKDGGGSASLGAQTAFQETSNPHSGSYCVRVETVNYLGGLVKVNGSLTTGYVNAPSTTKSEGYVGTTKYQGGAGDIRRIAFTSRPDSLVGYFKYTKGGTNEKAKIRVILHKDHYYDPETPATSNYTDPSANKVADALFISLSQDYAGWTRFSVPFNYVSTDSPQYVLVTATSSADQETNVAGSEVWFDDLEFIYNPASCDAPTALTATDNNDGSVSASWTAPAAAPSNGYLVAFAPQGTTPAAGDYTTASGASYTTTTYNGSPLVTGTTYVVYVKSDCGTLKSTEVTKSVIFNYATPTGCAAPTALTLTETAGKINASWTAPATAPTDGYIYAVTPQGVSAISTDFVSNASTSVSNIVTTTGTSPVALIAGNAYTVTVKSDCGVDGISSIVSKDITLASDVSVNTINGTAFQVYMNGQEVVVDLSDVEITNGIISILDLSGRKVATAKLSTKSVNSIMLPSRLTTGIYMYQIEGNGIIKTGKLAF